MNAMFNNEEIFCYLISRIFDSSDALLDESISVANTIASKSVIAVQGSKVNLNYARDHTVDDNFTFVVSYQQDLSSI